MGRKITPSWQALWTFLSSKRTDTSKSSDHLNIQSKTFKARPMLLKVWSQNFKTWRNNIKYYVRQATQQSHLNEHGPEQVCAKTLNWVKKTVNETNYPNIPVGPMSSSHLASHTLSILVKEIRPWNKKTKLNAKSRRSLTRNYAFHGCRR